RRAPRRPGSAAGAPRESVGRTAWPGPWYSRGAAPWSLLEDGLQHFDTAGEVADLDRLEGDPGEVAGGPRFLRGPAQGSAQTAAVSCSSRSRTSAAVRSGGAASGPARRGSRSRRPAKAWRGLPRRVCSLLP